ncbi:exosortase [Sphingomonas solaris]|uniref:Exosortase n=1 Tax=Alterirhizorhabdus solaris TaxID=2529389 RepID=A0A558QY30_9SPHN|nr:exosortase [Sphingomonas solaris]TVV71967.1 exosortase [Sphingomonas solaris]
MSARTLIARQSLPPPSRLFAVAGLACVILPTLAAAGQQHWSSPEGSQGPIILATGAWLLWRARATFARDAAPLRGWASLPVLAGPALLYAFGRAYGILSIETAMAYLLFVGAALVHLGPRLFRRFWFPLFYLAFLVVPPPTLVAEITQPLRLWISATSVDMFHALGYPVALSGATIQIAQYELEVRTACAGLNSMLTLGAIGLFYIHLRADAGIRYAALLVVAIVPVAILANFVRVSVLVLLAWYVGADAAQGLSHELAGLLMFSVAMLGLFVVDTVLNALGAGLRPRRG